MAKLVDGHRAGVQFHCPNAGVYKNGDAPSAKQEADLKAMGFELIDLPDRPKRARGRAAASAGEPAGGSDSQIE